MWQALCSRSRPRMTSTPLHHPGSAPQLLLLYAHPAQHKSRVNRSLFSAAEGLPGVTPRNLYELYPDFMVDVEAEQRLLEAHDVIVFQHPFYWYSSPALLKEYLDLVLERGWAYGDGGTALSGKSWQQVVTCGGSEDVYQPSGRHGHSVAEFLLPFQQSARLCGMTFLPPLAVHDAGALSDEGLAAEAQRFRQLLVQLSTPKS
jgi:glutathione-regulated potassium-efflux system ancillary protein KefG